MKNEATRIREDGPHCRLGLNGRIRRDRRASDVGSQPRESRLERETAADVLRRQPPFVHLHVRASHAEGRVRSLGGRPGGHSGGCLDVRFGRWPDGVARYQGRRALGGSGEGVDPPGFPPGPPERPNDVGFRRGSPAYRVRAGPGQGTGHLSLTVPQPGERQGTS